MDSLIGPWAKTPFFSKFNPLNNYTIQLVSKDWVQKKSYVLLDLAKAKSGTLKGSFYSNNQTFA